MDNIKKEIIYLFIRVFISSSYLWFINDTIRDSGWNISHLLVTKYYTNKIQNWRVCGWNFQLLISMYSPEMCQEEDQIRSCTVWAISYCDPIITTASHYLFYVPGTSNVWWISTKTIVLPACVSTPHLSPSSTPVQ